MMVTCDMTALVVQVSLGAPLQLSALAQWTWIADSCPAAHNRNQMGKTTRGRLPETVHAEQTACCLHGL